MMCVANDSILKTVFPSSVSNHRIMLRTVAEVVHSMSAPSSREAFCCLAGDSGSPLLIPDTTGGRIRSGRPEDDIIVGIKSFGKKGCDGKGPDAYASVGPVWDWIMNTVHQVSPSIGHVDVLSMRSLVQKQKPTESNGKSPRQEDSKDLTRVQE